jgi:hypothetical protein
MVVNLNKECKRRKQIVLWILGFLKDKTPTVDLPLWNFQRPRFVEDLNHVIVSVGVVRRQIVTLGMRLPDVAPDTTSWNSHVLCPLQLSGFHSLLRWKQTYATLPPSHISVQPPTTNIVEFANKPFYTSLMYRRCKVAPTSWWLPFQCRTRLLTYSLNRSLQSSMVVWAVRSLDWTGTKDVTIVNGQIGLKPWHLASLVACLWIVIHVVLGFKEEEVVEVACRPRSVSDFCVRCLEPLWVDGMDQGPQSSSTFPAF